VEDPRVPNLRIQAIALGHSTALSAGSGCKWPLTRKHSYRIVHPWSAGSTVIGQGM